MGRGRRSRSEDDMERADEETGRSSYGKKRSKEDEEGDEEDDEKSHGKKRKKESGRRSSGKEREGRGKRSSRGSSPSPSGSSSASSSASGSESSELESASGSDKENGDQPEENSAAREDEEKRERRKAKKRKERRRAEKEEEERRLRKKKRRKEKERKRREREAKKKEKTAKMAKSAVTDRWGKYGVIKEVDMWNKRPEFSAWLTEVKKVNLEHLSGPEEKQMFQEFMEDFNTATLPSKKYYSLDLYHRQQQIRAAEKGLKKPGKIEERTVFNDEDIRKQEMIDNREKLRDAEMKARLREMQLGMGQAMREQALLREEMQYQFRLGNFEAAEKIQKRLGPDDPFAPVSKIK